MEKGQLKKDIDLLKGLVVSGKNVAELAAARFTELHNTIKMLEEEMLTSSETRQKELIDIIDIKIKASVFGRHICTLEDSIRDINMHIFVSTEY